MQKTCPQCSLEFQVTDEDLAFYEKVSPTCNGQTLLIPPPTLCPPCRQQRRLAYRNDRKLYRRKCSLSGRDIVSIYPPEATFPVYEQQEWWGDGWDPYAFGKEVDFDRPFFDQWHELMMAVPKISLWTQSNENSEYTHDSKNDKDCYMCFGVDDSRDSYYCYMCAEVVDCADCYWTDHAELCYECIMSGGIYNCRHCMNCIDCQDCSWCFDCHNCKNCFGCCGLRQAEYRIFNEQFTKEEYEKRMQELSASRSTLNAAKKAIEAAWLKMPRKHLLMTRVENCSGDNITDSRNAHDCYSTDHCENGKYLWTGYYVKDGMDGDIVAYGTEVFYECQTIIGKGRSMAFNYLCREGLSDCYYCTECASSEHMFGCIGVRRGEYCILNKQYSKEEYEALLPKVVEHMKAGGEWGEFFPIKYSPIAYNASHAQDFYPMTRSEVEGIGWVWREDDEKKAGEVYSPPDRIEDVADDVVDRVLQCEVTGTPFKVIPQELKFYKDRKIPIPLRCPDQRQKDRLASINPHKLWDRECGKCGVSIKSTFAPERPETIYCESCYLKEVH